MRAGKGVRVVAAHAAADGLRAVVVEHQVGVPAGTMQPTIDPLVIFMNGSGDGHFGGGAIGVGGIRGDRLAIEALSQLCVSFPDMALESVAALSLVPGEVIAGSGVKSDMLCRFRGSLCRLGAAMKKQIVRENDEQNDNDQTSQPFSLHPNILLSDAGPRENILQSGNSHLRT